jgi:hypothetical protein
MYLAVLWTMPFWLFLLNRNWTFQGFGDYDAFYYFGHFIHFPHYQKLQPTYAGERLPWLLPGYALVHLFGAAYGTLQWRAGRIPGSVGDGCSSLFPFRQWDGLRNGRGNRVLFPDVRFPRVVRGRYARAALDVFILCRLRLGCGRLYLSLLDRIHSRMPIGVSRGGRFGSR